MKNCVIEIASFVSEVEPLDAPGKPFRQRDHYSNNILCIYALHDAPCDSSDLATLNDNKLTIIHVIDPKQYWGYTHIVKDLEGNLYAVQLIPR